MITPEAKNTAMIEQRGVTLDVVWGVQLSLDEFYSLCGKIGTGASRSEDDLTIIDPRGLTKLGMDIMEALMFIDSSDDPRLEGFNNELTLLASVDSVDFSFEPSVIVHLFASTGNPKEEPSLNGSGAVSLEEIIGFRSDSLRSFLEAYEIFDTPTMLAVKNVYPSISVGK